jgi:hypothetical protein
LKATPQFGKTLSLIMGDLGMKLILAGAVVGLTIAVVARGAVVLDQQYSLTSSIASSTNGDVSQIGETFTVGVAGTLDHIDVFMFKLNGIFDPTGDPQLQVYNISGGFPTGAALATVTIPENNVPLNNAAFVSFDLSSAAIAANIGTVLAFSLTATAGTGPYFMPNDQGMNGYTGGAAITKFGSNAWQQFPAASDHGFKTFVLTSGAPELFGDYNNNGVIDAADYSVWRKTVAAGGTVLPHDATPGVVDANDYSYWRAHYGNVPGAGAAALASASIPEPVSLVLFAAAFAAVGLTMRLR